MISSRLVVPPSLKILARHKRFSALAIFSLGIAIALNTTMYSVLDAMIRPKIEMRDPDRLVWFRFYGDYRRLIPLADKNRAVSELAFHEGAIGSRPAFQDRIIERGSRVREAQVLSVTSNYFAVVGARTTAGRLIGPADIGQDSRPVVLGERLWRQLFPEKDAFEPSRIFVGGEPRIVVGILPYAADFPGAYTDVWQLATPEELASMPLSVARLKADVTPEAAASELRTLTLRFAQQTQETSPDVGFRMTSATRPPFRPWGFHYALIAAVASVLLIACANLANLQLARGVSRARELATRSAVGATRRQIVRQLVLESAWLALGGLVLSAVLTVWGMRLIDAFVPRSVADYVAHPQVSWRVLLFAIIASLICLVLVGLAPALKLSQVNINEVLKSGAGTGKTRSMRRQYGLLVVIEVALAMSLLASASLLLSTAIEVHSFDLGHDYAGLVVTNIGVMPESPADRRNRRDWSDRLVAQALRVPRFTHAATVNEATPPRRAVSVDDPGGAPLQYTTHFWRYSIVSPDYFRTMRIPILQGRDFTTGEFAEPQVIVDDLTARYLWPGQNPIGRLIKLDSAHTREPWLRVVGVATATQRWFSTDRDAMKQFASYRRGLGGVYVLNAADTGALKPTVGRGSRFGEWFLIVARGTGNPVRLPVDLRQGLANLGSNTLVAPPVSWEQRSGIQRIRERQDFIATLFLVFASFAIALAALGVYAIVAHMVAQRTREFGVRIAIGASESDIRQLVVREGNVLALLGIAFGLIVTWQTASLLRAFLFSDYDRYDSRFFGLASVVLFAVAWVASYIPARRAMRVDPTEALRNE